MDVTGLVCGAASFTRDLGYAMARDAATVILADRVVIALPSLAISALGAHLVCLAPRLETVVVREGKAEAASTLFENAALAPIFTGSGGRADALDAELPTQTIPWSAAFYLGGWRAVLAGHEW